MSLGGGRNVVLKTEEEENGLIFGQSIRDQSKIKASLTGSETNLVSPRMKIEVKVNELRFVTLAPLAANAEPQTTLPGFRAVF